jgi:hypothetical protein
MRIEITSTQAGAPRTRALRTTVQPAVQLTVQPAASWAGPPLAASSLRVDPSKSGPFSVDPSKSGPFSPGCATPAPVRWDAVRG